LKDVGSSDFGFFYLPQRAERAERKRKERNMVQNIK
jgi:hypothetical protein